MIVLRQPLKHRIINKPIIIKYASNRLREDKEIGLAAMNVNKNCYEFLGPNLKKDEEILNIKRLLLFSPMTG